MRRGYILSINVVVRKNHRDASAHRLAFDAGAMADAHARHIGNGIEFSMRQRADNNAKIAQPFSRRRSMIFNRRKKETAGSDEANKEKDDTLKKLRREIFSGDT